jgi:hypothetical protein
MGRADHGNSLRNKEKWGALPVQAIDSRLTMPLDATAKFGMTRLEIAPLIACSGFVHGAVAFGGFISADGPGWGAIGLFFFEGRVARSRSFVN